MPFVAIVAATPLLYSNWAKRVGGDESLVPNLKTAAEAIFLLTIFINGFPVSPAFVGSI